MIRTLILQNSLNVKVITIPNNSEIVEVEKATGRIKKSTEKLILD
jgi:hypothetical protein